MIKEIGRSDLKLGPLTNLTDGGDGSSGHIASEETRKKMSKSISENHVGMLGKHHTEETRRKISRIGFKHTEETRKKISEVHVGKPKSLDHKKKLSESNIGKHLSEETKRKISQNGKGKGMFGKHLSEETKKKISESKKLKITKQRNSTDG